MLIDTPYDLDWQPGLPPDVNTVNENCTIAVWITYSQSKQSSIEIGVPRKAPDVVYENGKKRKEKEIGKKYWYIDGCKYPSEYYWDESWRKIRYWAWLKQ